MNKEQRKFPPIEENPFFYSIKEIIKKDSPLFETAISLNCQDTRGKVVSIYGKEGKVSFQGKQMGHTVSVNFSNSNTEKTQSYSVTINPLKINFNFLGRSGLLSLHNCYVIPCSLPNEGQVRAIKVSASVEMQSLSLNWDTTYSQFYKCYMIILNV